MNRRLVGNLMVGAVLALGVYVAEPAAGGPLLRSSSADSAITLRDGRLSAKVTDWPWDRLLRVLRRQTGMAVEFVTTPEGTVTVAFEDLRVEQALKRLFGADASFVFLYEDNATSGSAVPSQVWVLAPGEALPPGALAAGGRSTPQPTGSIASPRGPLGAPTGDGRRETDGDDAEAIPRLLTDLRDSRPEVRRDAAEVLGERGDERVVNPLAHLLTQDGKTDVRTTAAEALGQIGTAEALTALRQGLKDPDAEVRLRVVEAIAAIGDHTAAQVLREVALRSPDAELRRAATEALESVDVEE